MWVYVWHRALGKLYKNLWGSDPLRPGTSKNPSESISSALNLDWVSHTWGPIGQRHELGAPTNLVQCFTNSEVHRMGFPGNASGKEPARQCRNIRDMGLMPRSGRSPGGGYGNPLQYSCLENLLDRGAWKATVYRLAESDISEAT